MREDRESVYPAAINWTRSIQPPENCSLNNERTLLHYFACALTIVDFFLCVNLSWQIFAGWIVYFVIILVSVIFAGFMQQILQKDNPVVLQILAMGTCFVLSMIIAQSYFPQSPF